MAARKPDPSSAVNPAAVAPRPTIALPVPSSLELIAAGIVAVLLIAGGVGIYLKGHADGYAGAATHYEKLMADQAAANQAAVDAANRDLLATADKLSKSEADYDAVLAQLDAASGGAGATTGGLDQRRVTDLNTIK